MKRLKNVEKCSSKIIADIEHRIDLAKRLKALNIFITETFEEALKQSQSLSECSSGKLGLSLIRLPMYIVNAFKLLNIFSNERCAFSCERLF